MGRLSFHGAPDSSVNELVCRKNDARCVAMSSEGAAPGNASRRFSQLTRKPTVGDALEPQMKVQWVCPVPVEAYT